ncbi:MAG: hypothetical protein LBT74_02540 [Acidobacteriota bacterium]|jgi:hypothetical protein|nr:hypothetical protein [Acidobacteriota bacterium]
MIVTVYTRQPQPHSVIAVDDADFADVWFGTFNNDQILFPQFSYAGVMDTSRLRCFFGFTKIMKDLNGDFMNTTTLRNKVNTSGYQALAFNVTSTSSGTAFTYAIIRTVTGNFDYLSTAQPYDLSTIFEARSETTLAPTINELNAKLFINGVLYRSGQQSSLATQNQARDPQVISSIPDIYMTNSGTSTVPANSSLLCVRDVVLRWYDDLGNSEEYRVIPNIKEKSFKVRKRIFQNEKLMSTSYFPTGITAVNNVFAISRFDDLSLGNLTYMETL